MPGEGAPRPRRCAVIGAGVLGVCMAARLAEAGVGVTLLEQAQPGGGASGWSFAWLNANDKAPRAYHDLNHAGMRAWAGLSARLGGATWYRPVGNIEWAMSAAGRAQLAARVRRLAGWGYPARLVDVAEAAELEPSLRLSRPVPEVAWFPDEGYLLTEQLVSQLVELAARHGATVLTGAPGLVVGLDVVGGAVRAVRTAAGQVIPADVVVCCAGRWVPALAALAGAACPVPLVPWAAPGAAAPASSSAARRPLSSRPTGLIASPLPPQRRNRTDLAPDHVVVALRPSRHERRLPGSRVCR